MREGWLGMAVKSTETKSAAAAAKSDPPAETTEAAPAPERASRDCVVPADFHVGRATPGSKVCSYHAMQYRADGTPRGA